VANNGTRTKEQSEHTMRNRLVIVFSIVALLSSASLQAHHTGSTLLSDTTVTLKGVVKNWLWSNPHCLLTLEVMGADGQNVQWVIEAQAPNSIFPEGYRKNSFKPGDVVTVTANPVTNGRPYGRIAGVMLADGTTIGSMSGGGGRGRGRGAPVQ
jgi:hypothetical protein